MKERIIITLYSFILIALIVFQTKILYYLIEYNFFNYDSNRCAQIRAHVQLITPLEKIAFLKSTSTYDKYLHDKNVDSIIRHFQIMDSMYLNDQINIHSLK